MPAGGIVVLIPTATALWQTLVRYASFPVAVFSMLEALYVGVLLGVTKQQWSETLFGPYSVCQDNNMEPEHKDLMKMLAESLGSPSRSPLYPREAGTSLGQITGVENGYWYSELTTISTDVLKGYHSKIIARFREQVGETNSREEWMVRTHVAVKLLLSATVMMTSAHFAVTKRLRIVEPYLLYYALFNTSRSLVLLVPEEKWRDGAILDATTHTKTLNVTSDRLRLLSPQVSDEYKSVAANALAAREFFSYKFPAQGLKGEAAALVPRFEDVLKLCRFVAELAQFNSECLEVAFAAHGEPYGDFAEEPLRRFFEYQHRFSEVHVDDSDDHYRLGSLLRRLGRPVSLERTATDGLVEDFYAAWNFADNDSTDQYSPEDWGLILSL